MVWSPGLFAAITQRHVKLHSALVCPKAAPDMSNAGARERVSLRLHHRCEASNGDLVAVDQSESALQEWFGFAGFIYRRRIGQQFKPCLNQLARRECSLGNSFTRLDFSDLYIVTQEWRVLGRFRSEEHTSE